MGTIKRFEEIDAWQTARKLTRYVYLLSSKGTFARDFGLRDQMRRSSVSIMSNIAEGFESRTPSLFIEFLGRAKGSAGELRAQAYIAQDVGHITSIEFQRLLKGCELCSGQISRFMSYLRGRKKEMLAGSKGSKEQEG
ncbi:MAG: four helix bundle protein [Acidobacteria bacterium]|nr:four helix bundle protein [Acidobacteriota bacterium]